MIRFFLSLLLTLSAFCADFDCIVVGTSPFSLFEALYQSHSGKKVLILEESSSCGGAWKAIDICGVMQADLGCHQIGHDLELKKFLEEYAGCKIVSLDTPSLSFEHAKGPNGWYFSKGCRELMANLLQLIEQTNIILLTGTKAESVRINAHEHTAVVATKERIYTTHKLILTPTTCLNLSSAPQKEHKSKYFHLYLLIQDATPPRFTYHQGLTNGVSRAMNLTHFADLSGTGRQLIIIQTHHERFLSDPAPFLEALKTHRLVDNGAYILQAEPYIYESGFLQQGSMLQTNCQGIIEILQTGHFQNLTRYISKWKQTLKPYSNPSLFHSKNVRQEQ